MRTTPNIAPRVMLAISASWEVWEALPEGWLGVEAEEGMEASAADGEGRVDDGGVVVVYVDGMGMDDVCVEARGVVDDESAT